MVARVTNSMMANNLMNNLFNNLRGVENLQHQLSSGRRYAFISDNPTALIFEQAARNRMTRIEHYSEMVSTSRSWLTQAESGVMELQAVVGDIYEELTRAGGTMTDVDRQNIAKAVRQMKDHFVDTLNTSFGDRFVFGGFNTPGDFAINRNNDGIRPFAVNENGDLLLNGFNTSQFDGLPSNLFSINPNEFTNPTDITDPPAAGSFREELINRINTALGQTVPGTTEPLFPALNDLIGAGNSPEDLATNLQMMHHLMADVKSLEVGPGITMPITMNGMNVLFYTVNDPTNGAPIIRNMFSTIQEIHHAMSGDPGRDAIAADATTSPPTLARPARPAGPPLETDDFTLQISLAQGAQNHLLNMAAEIGGRQRRLDLLQARYEADMINYGQMHSDAADADIAEVIMNMRMAETVYQAALAAGARVIQPTLMDFLR